LTLLIINHNINIVIISAIVGILAFVITMLTMPRLIKRLENANIIGKDLHKITKPIVAEMGGIGILFGFIIGIFVGMYFTPQLTFQLSVALLVILLVGIIGMVDDLIRLSSKEKFILLFLAGLPLLLIAPPHIGLLYMIAIPIAFSIVSNLTNMLAGLNGIETGLGVIAMTSLTISCIILGKYDVAIISMSMLGALIAFLYYNKHPSKVFPGDTGTLIIGATIATIAVIGRVKLIAIIILIPNIIDAALKFYSAGVMERQQHKPTQINEEGNLIIPDQDFKSLIRWVIRKPISEKRAVHVIWAIGIIFGILGVLTAIFMPQIIGGETLLQFIKIKEFLYYFL
jgi:UDP-N-acetylglucosamine--dolichyl-phosphate N-acetylglucosaminephosphotransferase